MTQACYFYPGYLRMASLILIRQIRHMLTDIIERRRNRPLDRFFFKYSLRSNLFLFGKIQ